MVTDDDRRWTPGLHGLPARNGKLKEIDKFDASFFGIAPKQVDSLDPQIRLLLEVSYEAIVDAGRYCIGDVTSLTSKHPPHQHIGEFGDCYLSYAHLFFFTSSPTCTLVKYGYLMWNLTIVGSYTVSLQNALNVSLVQ